MVQRFAIRESPALCKYPFEAKLINRPFIKAGLATYILAVNPINATYVADAMGSEDYAHSLVLPELFVNLGRAILMKTDYPNLSAGNERFQFSRKIFAPFSIATAFNDSEPEYGLPSVSSSSQ